MERYDIAKHCQEWMLEDRKRVAIVILAEPDKEQKKDGTREYLTTTLIAGSGPMMASILAEELRDNAPFAEVVRVASEKPGMLQRKKVEEAKKKEK